MAPFVVVMFIFKFFHPSLHSPAGGQDEFLDHPAILLSPSRVQKGPVPERDLQRNRFKRQIDGRREIDCSGAIVNIAQPDKIAGVDNRDMAGETVVAARGNIDILPERTRPFGHVEEEVFRLLENLPGKARTGEALQPEIVADERVRREYLRMLFRLFA